MITEDTLDKYGLFSAKVPRYTSYPPANLFETDTGRRMQHGWLRDVRAGESLSLYVHIPFCRRLCWFCACRTQGTRTLRPVADYVDVVISEIAAVRALLPAGVSVSRLHLGGGTPTLLPPDMMDRLLDTIFSNFSLAEDHEFSVEIDPTEAAPDLLATLADWGMDRASIGVQDFAPRVQEAIGREQSFDVTRDVVQTLRDLGVASLNLDLLYGLPFQTLQGLGRTLEQVIDIQPDRLALYGYAHVPKMSKRQVMIDDTTLPGPRARHHMASAAQDMLVAAGYQPLGIDHFARPHDRLAQAARAGRMRRNFQGYTDDPCDTLIGFGASAISQFRGGFLQNAVSTAAYTERVAANGLAAHKGLRLSPTDEVMGQMIHALMCYGTVQIADLPADHADWARGVLTAAAEQFAEVSHFDGACFRLDEAAKSLTRVVAASFDGYVDTEMRHSAAI